MSANEWNNLLDGVEGTVLNAIPYDDHSFIMIGSFNFRFSNQLIPLSSVVKCGYGGVCQGLGPKLLNFTDYTILPSIIVKEEVVYVLYQSLTNKMRFIGIYSGNNWEYPLISPNISSIAIFDKDLYVSCFPYCNILTNLCADSSPMSNFWKFNGTCWSEIPFPTLFTGCVDLLIVDLELFCLWKNVSSNFGLLRYHIVSNIWEEIVGLDIAQMWILECSNHCLFFQEGILYLLQRDITSLAALNLTTLNWSNVYLPCGNSRVQLEFDSTTVFASCLQDSEIQIFTYDYQSTQPTISKKTKIFADVSIIGQIVGREDLIFAFQFFFQGGNQSIPNHMAIWSNGKWEPISAPCTDECWTTGKVIMANEEIYLNYFEFQLLFDRKKLYIYQLEGVEFKEIHRIEVNFTICDILLTKHDHLIYYFISRCEQYTLPTLTLAMYNTITNTSIIRTIEVDYTESSCQNFFSFDAIEANHSIIYLAGCFGFQVNNIPYDNIAKYDFLNDEWLFIEKISSSFGIMTLRMGANQLYVGGIFSQAGNLNNLGNVVGCAENGTFVDSVLGGVPSSKRVVLQLEYQPDTDTLFMLVFDQRCPATDAGYSIEECWNLWAYVNKQQLSSQVVPTSVTTLGMIQSALSQQKSESKKNHLGLILGLTI